MLVVNNLAIKLLENNRELIADLSFTAQLGDKIAIIGEEGNGKSTLLKAIYNSELISNYAQMTGTIASLNYKKGYLSQTLDEKDKNKTIEEYILTDETGQVDYNLYQSIYSNQIFFSDFNLNLNIISSNRTLQTFSGGERIKLGLIKLILQEPDLILLDEPTNDLDLTSLAFLEKFIINTKKPIIYISHDETLLEKTANKIIHLEQRKRKMEAVSNVFNYSYNEYVEQRLGMIRKETQIAKMQRKKYQVQKEILNEQYNKVHHELKTITRADPAGARLLKKKIKSIKSYAKRFEKEKEEFLTVPDVEEALKFNFDNDIYVPSNKEILKLDLKELKINNTLLSEKIKLNVIGPEHVVIIGDNGVGKSTLIKYIYDELKERNDIKVEYMPQLYSEFLDHEMIAYKFVSNSLSDEDISKARTIMGCMKFTANEMISKIKHLSGGQKAKLFLIKIILRRPDVLILDEPTRNLSPLSNPVIRDVLANYKGAIISISHDRKYINEVCDKVYFLTNHGLELIDFSLMDNYFNNKEKGE